MSTKPQVFIIESLPNHGPSEGELLHKILAMAGQQPIFEQCPSSSDFRQCLKKFKTEQYRFLHISCHGIGQYIDFSNGEHMAYGDFAQLFNGIPFEVSRIFFSTCGSGNSRIAEEIFKVTKSFYSFIPCSGGL